MSFRFDSFRLFCVSLQFSRSRWAHIFLPHVVCVRWLRWTSAADVDFRPSRNLHEALHSEEASVRLLEERKAVVCPAFECTSADTACPRSVSRLRELVEENLAEGFHRSHFPQGHGPTDFEMFWEKSLAIRDTTGPDFHAEAWNECYAVAHSELFEPYVAMASRDVPLYDERFQGYGLNKVSHLASVARQKGGEFWVLPGVFMVAPVHERSESWGKIYGSSKSDDRKFNQLVLKGLYYDFTRNNLESPVVSANTQSKHHDLSEREKETKQELEIRRMHVADPIKHPVSCH